MMELMDDRNGFNWFMFLEVGRRKPIVHKLASFNSLIVLEPENKHDTNMSIKRKFKEKLSISLGTYEIFHN